jgi:solute carrier family 50 protein (sugar transporter)
VVIYIIYAPKKEKAKISGLLMFVLTVFSAVAFVSLFALHDKSRKLFCGFAATIFSIIMYASPLSIMVSYFSYFLDIYIYVFWGMNLIAIWVPN